MTSRVAEVVEAAIAAGHIAGAAVIVRTGDRTLVEHYAGMAAPGVPAAASTVWPLASISKCFTAAMVMRLAELGELSLRTTVGSILPMFRGDGRDEVTVRHLLSHTSGLRYESPSLDELLRARVPLRTIVEDACAAPLLFRAGTRFSYSDDGYLLAGLVAEVVTGTPFAELVQSHVVEPMGLHDTWVVPPLAAYERIAIVRGVMAEGTDGAMYNSAYARSLAHPAFGVLSSAPDLLRFAAHFAPDGPRIHLHNSVELMTTSQVADAPGVHPLRPELGEEVAVGWGLTFEVQTANLPGVISRFASSGAFGHPGATGCYVAVDPLARLEVVALTNTHLRTGLAPWVAGLSALTDAAFEDGLAAP